MSKITTIKQLTKNVVNQFETPFENVKESFINRCTAIIGHPYYAKIYDEIVSIVEYIQSTSAYTFAYGKAKPYVKPVTDYIMETNTYKLVIDRITPIKHEQLIFYNRI